MDDDIKPTDPHKMHRSDDPETSVDRAYDLDTESQKVVLITAFMIAGVNGMTTSEVAKAIGKDRATFSSTITQLRREDLLFYSGIRRDKQNVWVATKYRTDWALVATEEQVQAMNEQHEKDQEGAIKDRKLRALEEENHRILEELNCQDSKIDLLKKVWDAGWLLHHTAREQGGSLTVVGTDEYKKLCTALKEAMP